MRVSWEWLNELADLEGITAQQGAHTLTMIGFTVESVDVLDLSEILIGRVISQEPHPQSRSPLWIHQVDIGGGVTRQIIAGAPNAVPGSLVPVALPGTTVPNGRYVRDAKIAGYAGEGMLCSREELLLGEDNEPAIMLLDSGEPGQRLSELIPPDAIFEVEVTPNRPDCLGHLGLARELAAATGRRLKVDFLPPFVGEAEPPATELISVRIEALDLCRRYIAGVIRDVHPGPSPKWMQRRLRAAGVRPINNLVDVTQYVMLEYGQPLHVFDMAKIGGAEIVVRRARDGESIHCLDGVTRQLNPNILVIADNRVPMAIAGVIGGEESAVGDLTRDVVLEAATFDGVNIRATSRALKIRTDASSRFEKKLSPELALAGARRASQLIAELAGGSVHQGWPDEYPAPQEPVRVRMHPEKIDQVLGVHVPLEEAEAILRRLDFQVRAEEGVWDVLPPVFRLDVAIAEDVVEEVGRIYGVEQVPATLPGSRRSVIRPYRPSADRELDPARHAFTAGGYTETLTTALVEGRLLERLGIAGRSLRVINPVSEDMDTLRTSLLPSLLQVIELNRNRGRQQVSVFELGRVYLARDGEGPTQPAEPWILASAATAGATSDDGRRAFLHLKSVLDRVAHELSVPALTYRRAQAPLYHPGRCAVVLAGSVEVGHLGELHPTLSGEFDLEGRAVACELDVEALLGARQARSSVELPRFPAVDRDLNVVVREEVEAAEVLETVRGMGGGLLEAVRAFDEYRGAQVGDGLKSLAVALTFRSPERTLTDAEVDEVMRQVRAALETRHGARFRT
jgi:phenylalanyl-tRNA synthetase beta chain